MWLSNLLKPKILFSEESITIFTHKVSGQNKFQPNLPPKLDILDSDFGSSNKKLQGKEKKFWIKKSKSGSRFYRGG